MKIFGLSNAAAIIATLAIASVVSSARAEDGWKQLFNGKDKEGWTMAGPGEFKVEDGLLVTYGGMGLLWYNKEKFGNCEIKVVYKSSKNRDNSGVFIRIDGEPKDPWFAVHHGYEVQIDDAADPFHRTGSLYSLTEAKATVDAKPGEWITMLIKLDGDRTISTVNGKEMTDYKEGQPVPPKKAASEPERGPRPQMGFIGLQNHDKGSKVSFKEVSVKPLPKK